MLPYLLPYLLTAFCAWSFKSRKDSVGAAVFFSAFLVFFAGTRVNVGCDYTGYLSRFDSFYINVDWEYLLSLKEAGFHALNYWLIQEGFSYSILILICSFFFVGCILRFSMLHERPLTVLALCFPIVIIQLGMSGLRQALAVGFVGLAMVAFVQMRRVSVIGWILLASQFHTSAVIFLPLGFMVGRNVSVVKIAAALVVLGPFAGWFLGDRAEVYVSRYVDQIYGENSSSGAWVRYFFVLVPFVLFERQKRLIEIYSPRLFPLLRLFSLVTFSLAVVGAFSSVALHRLVYYVMPISILAVACLCQAEPNRKRRNDRYTAAFCAYFAYMIFWFTFSSHSSSCYVPYNSWLF